MEASVTDTQDAFMDVTVAPECDKSRILIQGFAFLDNGTDIPIFDRSMSVTSIRESDQEPSHQDTLDAKAFLILLQEFGEENFGMALDEFFTLGVDSVTDSVMVHLRDFMTDQLEPESDCDSNIE
jgi:hypothetical protein